MRTSHLKLLIILPVLSLACYTIDYLLFRNQQDIENWILNSLGFVFIDVLLVTIILQDILERRERASRLGKLNNLIGLFFTECGLDLLEKFLSLNTEVKCESCFAATTQWSAGDFDRAIDKVRSANTAIRASPEDLEGVKNDLVNHRDFLVRMMESPNLFEHERFTDLMMAILHLDEELKHRKNLYGLPRSDIEHLNNDCLRVFQLLVGEWLEHMKHLRQTYPYLYSLAVRINPLRPDPDPVVNIRPS
ncbi:MAG: hypothetical protein SA339_11085 [Methanomassiliicoccus sp.]|nr:hypothetical protein [Methanomassiliicoccus sp.]